MKQSLFRKLTYKKLSSIKLDGNIVDFGGVKQADYHNLIKGDNSIIVVNSAENTNPDMLHDLENMPTPIDGDSCDAVLMINLLEHIYNYNDLIKDSARILKTNGNIILAVPFLYYVHASPNDYFRYSKQALEKMMKETGFTDIQITEIGEGAFSSAFNLVHRFFPSFINFFLEKIAVSLDIFVKSMSKMLKKKYSGTEYPMGYFIKAVKNDSK